MSSILVHALFPMLTIAAAVVLPPYFEHSITAHHHLYTSTAVQYPYRFSSGHDEAFNSAPSVHADSIFQPITPDYFAHDTRTTFYDAHGKFGDEHFSNGGMQLVVPLRAGAQTGVGDGYQQMSSTARTTYADYLIKPLHCAKVSTHCCGSKTYIVATCGGSKDLLITFISANDYNYTLRNTHFTDLSGRYFLGSVKICNLGPEGDAFVSVW